MFYNKDKNTILKLDGADCFYNNVKTCLHNFYPLIKGQNNPVNRICTKMYYIFYKFEKEINSFSTYIKFEEYTFTHFGSSDK
jgi:hypothetical protein